MTNKDRRLVFTPWITKNGKRIYHPSGGLFVFLAKSEYKDKYKGKKKGKKKG